MSAEMPNPDRPARLAFVGASDWMQRYHLAAAARLRETGALEIRGIWNRTGEKAARLSDRFAIPRVYETLDELKHDRTLDGVVVVVSRTSVFEVLMSLAECRLPILTEKPPGDTPEQAERLAETFGERGVVGFNRRFVPLHDRFRELIGASGLPHLAECRFARRGRRDPRFVTESGVHAINLLEWLLGPIASLDARCGPDAASSSAPPLHRRALARFAGGAEAFICFLPRAGYACEHYTVHASDRTLTLECAAHYTDESESRIVVREHRGGAEPAVSVITEQERDPLERGGFMGEYREFLELIRTGRPPRSSFRSSVSSVRLSHCVEHGGRLP